MSVIRTLPFLFFLSLLAGAGLLLGFGFTRTDRQGAYLVLICDEEFPDRDLRQRLAERGFTGLVSESSQWALLDGFGTLERVPLDEYPARVLPFDPRNDGYAERLRLFFVRDGKRFLFIPRDRGVPGGTEKRIAAAMAGIPYSLEYLDFGKPSGFFFLLFVLCAFVLLLIRRRRSLIILACLPVLVPLALDGAPGFMLAALLAGLTALLREPGLEFFTALHYRRRTAAFSPAVRLPVFFLRDVYEPFKLNWLLSPVFPAGCLLIIVFSDIALVFSVVVIAAFAGITLFSLWALSRPGSRAHLRFSPLQIIKPASFNIGFAWTMLPFVLSAFVSVFAGPLAGGSSLPGPAGFAAELGKYAVTEAEYRAHALFQISFSARPLGRDIPPKTDTYASYMLDSDGLVSPAPHSTAEDLQPLSKSGPTQVPSFPLKRIMGLWGVGSRGAAGP
jgi:hypothetical protein